MKECKKKVLATVLFVALFVFVAHSFAQQLDYSDDELASDGVAATDIAGEEDIVAETGYSKADLVNIKEKDPMKFDQIMSQRIDHLKDLRQSNPEKYQKIMERVKQKRADRIERLKQENPERYEKIMEQRRARLDHKEDTRDRREDVLDRREDIRDKKEDVWDAQHQGGRRDKLEDIRDRQEDVRDRKEDVGDRKEDVHERKHDQGLHRGQEQGVRDHGAGVGRGKGQGSVHRKEAPRQGGGKKR